MHMRAVVNRLSGYRTHVSNERDTRFGTTVEINYYMSSGFLYLFFAPGGLGASGCQQWYQGVWELQPLTDSSALQLPSVLGQLTLGPAPASPGGHFLLKTHAWDWCALENITKTISNYMIFLAGALVGDRGSVSLMMHLTLSDTTWHKIMQKS